LIQPQKDKLLDYLNRHPYFETLTVDAIQVLIHRAVPRDFERDTIIFLEGHPSTGMYINEAGRVRIYKMNSEGEEKTIHIVGKGGTFNDIAAFDGGPNPAYAAALSDVRLWVIPTGVLEQAMDVDPMLARRIIKALSQRVRTLVDQIADLTLYSVVVRLARFLIQQTENPALDGPGITRALIANYLATTPESVSRALGTLKDAGAIDFDRQNVDILDRSLLHTIASM